MRIDCPKCGAAFAIDERRIPPKGVRAQCPLCGDRVVVRLPAAAGAGAAPARPATAAAGSGAIPPPAPTMPVAAPAPPMPVAFPARPAPAPFPPPPAPLAPVLSAAPPPEPARESGPYLATVDESYTPGPLGLLESPFPVGAPTPAERTPPPAPFAGFEDLPFTPAGGVSPASTPRPAAPPAFSGVFLGSPFAADAAAPPVPAPSDGSPASAFSLFGDELPAPEPTASNILDEIAPPPEYVDLGPAPAAVPEEDPFADIDPVRELTDPGGAAAPPLPGQPGLPPPQPIGALASPGGGAVWKIRRADGSQEPPVDFARLKAMVESHELADADMIARGEATFWPASSHPAVQSILRRSRPVVATARIPEPPRRFPKWVPAVGLGVLLAVALGVWIAWPAEESPALRMTREAFGRRLAAWKDAVPAPAGTAEEHERKGRALLREDTPEALRSALEEFRLAALLDPGAAGAIAGYVEARALLGFGPRDREAVAEAQELIDHAAQVAGKDPAVLRANAHLLLSLEVTGNLLQARTLAEAALERSGGATDDLVAVGRSFLGSNPDTALQTLDRALGKDPQHRRALLYRGQAKERLGRPAAAVEDYEARLALSPADPEARKALLRVAAEVGAHARIRRLLEDVLARKPGDPEARLRLAVLAYQVDGDARRAAAALGGLVADKTLTVEILGPAAGHAAALAREAGDRAAAAAFVVQAPGSDEAVAPARFQEALLALRAGRPDEARLALAAIPAGALDSCTRSLLEGRIHLAGSAPREAVAAFQAAQRAAPRRIDPYLFLASAYARLGDAGGAFGAIRGALELDPAASRRRGAPTDFYESPRSRLAGLEAPLLELAGNRIEHALAHAAAGIVRYHRGEPDAAVPLLERTLDLDPQAMAPLAYLAQIALDRGDAPRALELARSAAGLEKLLALGPFLEGRAREALGQGAEAAAAYERALAANASFTPAAARLGALALAAGDREEARKRLLQAVQGDPENVEARGALFQLGG